MIEQAMTGQTISHYRILEKLGEGGMGVVYKAEDTKLGRLVALKFLPQSSTEDEDSRRRFLEEARAAAALNHPNICTVYEIDEERGFLAMEFVDGETLDAKRKRRPLPVEEALGIAVHVADGLQAAHELGVVHRDIKSANIMLNKKGQVKIMDFGLARLSTRARLTRTGVSLGTPAYMAPELFEADTADGRSDIWSLGVVIHELIAGKLPFEAESEAALLYAVLHKEPEPLTSLRSDLPPGIDRVLKKALSKEPAARYQHVEDLTVDLRALLGEEVPASTKTNRRIATPMAAILLIAVAGGGFWIWREQGRIAREKAMQQVETLADRGAMMEAYRLAQMLDEGKPNDPAMKRVWDAVGVARPVLTDPSGADVYIRDYMKPESEWVHVGRSPIDPARLPLMFLSWRVTKQGYADTLWANHSIFMPVVKLTPKESTPPGMVLVLGTGRPDQPAPLDDFWMDRYEVTNAEYKKFVDAGGYRDRKYWKQIFQEGGHALSWEEGMKRLVDATGRPGPAKWELGAYAEGSAELPVTGVSWFEAAAYAEFVGKELPTVPHWRQAALYRPLSSEIVLLSNFGGKGLAPVGKFQGANFFGAFDTAGNAKEWCWNESGRKRYIMGGAWSEPSYVFGDEDARVPFERAELFGFRCVRYSRPVAETLKGPLTRQVRDYSSEKPATEEQFLVYKSLYSYDRSPLDAKVEAQENNDPAWRIEKITFNAAYGNERVVAYLYLPKNAATPYQTVVHFPAGFAPMMNKMDSLSLHWIRFIVQSGRAVLYPVYKGTYERRIRTAISGPLAWRDLKIQMCKDLSRSVDYVESRQDLNHNKLGYYGISMGSITALPCLAVDNRFQAIVLQAGGLPSGESPPESDAINFVSRIRAPVLMINGRNDFDTPFDQLQVPLFRLLGSPPGQKRHFLVESGHVVPRNLVVKETLDWFDRYLGPVQ